jgi:hypothetical protein
VFTSRPLQERGAPLRRRNPLFELFDRQLNRLGVLPGGFLYLLLLLGGQLDPELLFGVLHTILREG